MKSFKFVFPLFLVVLLGCSGGKSSQNSGLAALALSGSGGSSNSSPAQVVSLNLSQAFGGKSGLTDVVAVRSPVALSASLTSSSNNILSANTWKRLSDLTSSVKVSKGQVLNFAIVPKTGNLTDVDPIEIGTYTGTGKTDVIGFKRSDATSDDGSGISLKTGFNPHGVTAVALIARDKTGFNFSTLKTESSKLAKATSSNLSAVIRNLNDSTIQSLATDVKSLVSELVKAALGQKGKELYTAVLERYADIAYHTYSKAYKDAVNMSNTIQTRLISKPSPNDYDLVAMKNEWVKARASYLLVEAFRFSNNPIDTKGIFACNDNTATPSTTSKGECEGYMNAWPLSETTIDAYITSKSLDSITFADILSRNEKDRPSNGKIDTDVKIGWHAIEYLLWGQDTSEAEAGSRSISALTGSGVNQVNEKRRKYLSEVTNGLVAHLKALRDQWDPKKTDNFRNKTFQKDSTVSVRNIFRGLGKLLAGEIGSERLSLGLGSQNQENEHSCFSDNTKADFFYDIQGILNIWEGKYELKLGTVEPTLTANGRGLKDLVIPSNPTLANQITNVLVKNRDYFCLNIYNVDPNYKRDCSGVTKINGRYDQVILKSNNEQNKLKAVESSFILELRTQITKAGKAVGVTITDFTVN